MILDARQEPLHLHGEPLAVRRRWYEKVQSTARQWGRRSLDAPASTCRRRCEHHREFQRPHHHQVGAHPRGQHHRGSVGAPCHRRDSARDSAWDSGCACAAYRGRQAKLIARATRKPLDVRKVKSRLLRRHHSELDDAGLPHRGGHAVGARGRHTKPITLRRRHVYAPVRRPRRRPPQIDARAACSDWKRLKRARLHAAPPNGCRARQKASCTQHALDADPCARGCGARASCRGLLARRGLLLLLPCMRAERYHPFE